MEFRDFSRKFALVALSAAVLGATAACTGSSSGSTNAGTGGTSSASSTSTAQATSTSTAQAGGTQTSTAASTSTSHTQPAAAGGPSSCTGSQLKTALGRGGAATGHDVVSVVFTNTSDQTCTLQGYPGTAVMNGSTVVLNATRTLNGFAGDERQLTSAPLVTLAPGAVASANIEWVVDNGEPCAPNGTGTLDATPPNTQQTTDLKPMTVGTQGICAGFEVHPVVAGTL